MQQRRVRLGDILDDYCPRERRITNHAVVAMIEDEVKQTRCTTCDADHEYKQAKVPSSRRKKPEPALVAAAGTEAAAFARPDVSDPNCLSSLTTRLPRRSICSTTFPWPKPADPNTIPSRIRRSSPSRKRSNSRMMNGPSTGR
jgi:hypothetical protein